MQWTSGKPGGLGIRRSGITVSFFQLYAREDAVRRPLQAQQDYELSQTRAKLYITDDRVLTDC